jgi:hypothetical protein
MTSENSVYAELWISFASLIRSYVAAHDLGRPVGQTLVDSGENGHLTLRDDGKILTLEFESTTGSGSWTVYEDDPGPERVLERGKFKIGEDSQVELNDRRGKLELEVAAEAFTAKVFDEE